MLKKTIWRLLAIGYSIALAYICLMPAGKVPYFSFKYIDKVFHFITSAILYFLWYKAFQLSQNKHTVPVIIIMVIVYGIIIEVLQELLTETRVASITDIVANSVGVAIVSLILTIRSRTIVKKI